MSAIDFNFDLSHRLTAAWPPSEWSGLHVLAAVSGGADSMALLRALVEAKRRAGGAGRVFAGHVNHHLRGAASDDDERWLCHECGELGVSLEVRREDAAALAATEGDGLEAAARSARYRLLAQMAEAAGARFVVTAHTRDDQAETVLFRVLRGAGLRGLAGMRRFRKLSTSVTLVRPLLDVTRRELEAYLHGLGQAWREDASNVNVKFSRNRLRHELLPYVREHFNADADAAIARTASLAAEAQELVESLAADLLASCTTTWPTAAGQTEIVLKTAPLAGQPDVLIGETLRQAWRRAGLPEQAMTHRWWRQLAQLALSTDSCRTLNLPGNVLAHRADDLLVLAPPSVP